MNELRSLGNVNAQQFRSRYGPARGGLNPLCQGRRKGDAVLKHPDHPHAAHPAGISQFLVGGPGHPGEKTHTPIVNRPFTESRGLSDLLRVDLVHALNMDRWPHRKVFAEKLKAWREAKGYSMEESAGHLGVTYQTLRQYLYRENTRPSLEKIQVQQPDARAWEHAPAKLEVSAKSN